MAAAAAQAASSSAVVGGCSSRTSQLTLKRWPLRLSILRPGRLSHAALRHSPKEIYRLRASAVNEIAVDGSSNAATVTLSKPELRSEEEAPEEIKETTISGIIADVANLIKLVDTRDVVELELKHQDYELVIRKKEAIAPPPVATQMISPQLGPASYPVYASPPPAAPAVSAAPTPAPASTQATAAPAQPSTNLPRILSPMAGTFYKCPAPGEPAFVKVGDKVTKGQVICIVEAMKLMNEIEADQSGTVMEILAEDGKPVAVDTPLFAIKP